MKFSTQFLNFAFIVFCFMLISCGTAKTLVLEAPAEPKTSEEIQIVESKSTVAIPNETKEKFNSILQTQLYEKGVFKQGDDITLEYRFLQYKEGNRAARWLTGGLGNAGEGNLTVEVIYKNGTQSILAKIQVSGKIGSGFFGGSIDSALTQVATDVTKFTQHNFSVQTK